MDQRLVVVIGASGHIGRRLTELLLEARQRVRVVARQAAPLERFAAAGAEVVAGSIEDPALTRRAFAGADAAFTLLPPLFVDADLRGHQNRISAALAEGLQDGGVRTVVNLSSWGAEVPYGTGPIAGLHDHEERLDQLPDTDVVHLRAAYFMENLLGAVPMIQSQGAVFGTVRGDLPLPMIATEDVATEAWRLLAARDFEDKSTRELLGPRDYTFTEAAAILGRTIKKPDLRYLRVDDEQMRLALLAAGLPAHLVDQLLEMYRAIDSGKVHAAEPRLLENTTLTTLEDWAQASFAAAFRTGAPAH